MNSTVFLFLSRILFDFKYVVFELNILLSFYVYGLLVAPILIMCIVIIVYTPTIPSMAIA